VSKPSQDWSICILHWTVGLVVLLKSCLLAFEPGRIHGFARTGFPHWIRPALAWPEIVAAILFLVPAVTRIGAWALLVIFGVAALLHLLHAQYDISELLVYGAGVLVVLRHAGGRASREARSS
jgi:uncharacterized membrane protein YphA (DoxX/SURF4 family)